MPSRAQVECERLFYVHSKLLNNVLLGVSRTWLKEQSELADVHFLCNFDNCRILLSGIKRDFYLSCGESESGYFSCEYALKHDLAKIMAQYSLQHHFFYHNITKELCLIYSPTKRLTGNEADMVTQKVHDTIVHHLTACMPSITGRCNILTVSSEPITDYRQISHSFASLQVLKGCDYFLESSCVFTAEAYQNLKSTLSLRDISQTIELLDDRVCSTDRRGAFAILEEVYLNEASAMLDFSWVEDLVIAISLKIHRWESMYGFTLIQGLIENMRPCANCNIREALAAAKRCIEACISQIQKSNLSIPPLVQQALCLIHAQYKYPLYLSAISAKLGVNEAYLSRVFSSVMGITFSRYVAQYRVERAKHILLDPHCTVKSVAHAVGFSSENHFYRVFRQITGKTPAKYREQSLRFSGRNLRNFFA